ncbi:hypothetical protein P3L10_011796 [Capsicum annuum]
MGEVPVFAETNLSTRIVLLVSPYATANHFNREVERAHLNCFPQLGQIKVDALMLERNSCFYHLPETLPLKYVLKGFRSLLHVYVSSTISGPIKFKTCTTGTNSKCRRRRRRKVEKMKRLACLKDLLLRILHLSKKKKKMKKKINKVCLEELDELLGGCDGEEPRTSPSDLSEAVSVSGIIRNSHQ